MKDNYFIKIDTISDYTNLNDLKITGEFKVPNLENSIKDKNSRILKHIILVVTRSGDYQSVTPFDNVVVFKDDVKINSDIVAGIFNINLKDNIDFDGIGIYFVSCSLGACISNTLKIQIK